MVLVPHTTDVTRFRSFQFHDDFTEYVDGNTWTSELSASSTIMLEQLGFNGFIEVKPQVAVANAHAYAFTTGRLARIRDQVALELDFGVVNTWFNNNLFFGVASSVPSDFLQDNEGGINSSVSSYVGIYRQSDESNWSVTSKILANSEVRDLTTVDSTVANNYYSFKIVITPLSNSTVEISYLCDTNIQNIGSRFVPFRRATGEVIKHYQTFSGETRMNIVIANKNDSGGTGADACDVDYCSLVQTRSTFEGGQ